MSPFSAPFSGHCKARGRCSQGEVAAFWEGPASFGRNRESRSRAVRYSHPGYGTAGAGIWPEAVPRNGSAAKGASLLNWKIGAVADPLGVRKREQKRSLALGVAAALVRNPAKVEP